MAALGGFLFPSALQGCAIVLHHPLDPALFLGSCRTRKSLSPSPRRRCSTSWRKRRRCGGSSIFPPCAESVPAPRAGAVDDRDLRQEYGVEVVNFYGSNEGISLFATPRRPRAPGARGDVPATTEDADIATRVVDPDTGAPLSGSGERGRTADQRGHRVRRLPGLRQQPGVQRRRLLPHRRPGGNLRNRRQLLPHRGRCKDIINRGGMKISPAEIDLALEQHPRAEAAACAYPDERLGKNLRLPGVARGGEPPTLQALQDPAGAGFRPLQTARAYRIVRATSPQPWARCSGLPFRKPSPPAQKLRIEPETISPIYILGGSQTDFARNWAREGLACTTCSPRRCARRWQCRHRTG